MKPKIQFILGLNEKVLPKVRLTRSRDGSTGTATFIFKKPNLFNKHFIKKGEIKCMYLIDKEGVLETHNINAYFFNGKPKVIKSIYIIKSRKSWDRFIRFMKRYSQYNGLIFTKAI